MKWPRQREASEPFTERARLVIALARDEAQTLKHDHVGTEHILLGLLREEKGVATRVLEALGICVEEVRVRVTDIIGPSANVAAGRKGLTPLAENTLALARREARSLGHDYVATEHVLLALVCENKGLAARILLDLGADPERIRHKVINTLSAPVRREVGSVSRELDAIQ